MDERLIEELYEIINSQSIENGELYNKIHKLEDEIKGLKSKIHDHMDRDALTGLYNREMATEAYLSTKTVIMCDIDDFKHINDTYGHNMGDEVLMAVANELKNSVRNTDYVLRWGGEEFVIFIDNESLEVAYTLAERIRKRIELLQGYVLEDGKRLPKITMSFGVSKLNSEYGLKKDIELVDEALYKSKRTGKNKTTIAANALEHTALTDLNSDQIENYEETKHVK